MISRRAKAAMFVAGIIAFSATLLLGVVGIGLTGPVWVAIFWGVVWGIALVVTVIGFIGFLRETAPDLDAGEPRVVTAPSDPLPPATDRKNPWPAAWLAPAFADAFAGTPYVVRSNGHSVLVHADLVDARWQHAASVHHLEHTFVARFTPTDTPGVLKRTDESRRVEGHAGAQHIGAQVAVQSGRQVSYTRRVEYGLGIDGFKKRVDYEFSTSEINQPVKEILARAGWRTTLDAETKGALVIGALGASAAIIVPVVFLVKWLIGG